MTKAKEIKVEEPTAEIIERGFVYSFTENGKRFEGHREILNNKERFVVFPANGFRGYDCPLDMAERFTDLKKEHKA